MNLCLSRGQSHKNTDVFRKHYNKIGENRAVLPEIVCVAMTATAPPDVATKILDSLHMDRNVCTVRVSPERQNIR